MIDVVVVEPMLGYGSFSNDMTTTAAMPEGDSREEQAAAVGEAVLDCIERMQARPDWDTISKDVTFVVSFGEVDAFEAEGDE